MLPTSSSSSYHRHWKQYNAHQTWPRRARSIMCMICTCCIFLLLLVMYHSTTVAGQQQMIAKLEQLNQEHQQQILRHIEELAQHERKILAEKNAHEKSRIQIMELTQQLKHTRDNLELREMELTRAHTKYTELEMKYQTLQMEHTKLLSERDTVKHGLSLSHPHPRTHDEITSQHSPSSHETSTQPSPSHDPSIPLHDDSIDITTLEIQDEDIQRKEWNEHIHVPDIVDVTTIVPQHRHGRKQEEIHTAGSSDLSSILGNISTLESRRTAIIHEFRYAFTAYETYAWGKDEVHPISQRGDGGYHMGLTIVDSLDTIIIMGLDDLYDRCRIWIRDELSFGHQEDINTFETTIRVIGGLLSAYALKNDPLFLNRAEDLASRMLMAFDSKTGLPYGTLGLKTGKKYNPSWSGGASTVAEVGSIQLEWQYLARATGKQIYAEKVDAITQLLYNLHRPLLPQFISVDTGQLTSNVITMGARVDSVYEYYLKQYLLSGKTKELPKQMYLESMKAVGEKLVTTSHHSKLKFIAELHDNQKKGKMDHLVCFVPGMLALGVYTETVPESDRSSHMELAIELTHTCHEFYKQTSTGLAPEIVQFQMSDTAAHDFDVDPHAQHCMLRPETMESYFIMWRVTHDEKYRTWGWEMFESFIRYARLPTMGYSGLRDVRINTGQADGKWTNWDDKMESFFLAETFKYLYLLFSEDDVISLDKYVFNTEAHPLPIAIADPPAPVPL